MKLMVIIKLDLIVSSLDFNDGNNYQNVAMPCKTKKVLQEGRMQTHATSCKLLQTYTNACKLVHTTANERKKRSEKGCLVLRQGSV